MRSNLSALSLAIVGLVLGTIAARSKAADLAIDSPAPPLALTHWYKGTPFKTFEPGRVYVVEFWATWCGPCKRSIPHLTQIQKKYADRVTVLGVDVWERPEEETDTAIAELAKPFVERMGDSMAYSVAGDGVDRKMADSWLKAAGEDGIPTSFVVDGTGHIAWIGMPDGLEPVLDTVLAGKWDRLSEKKKLEAARIAEENSPQTQALRKLIATRKAGDYKGVLAILDDLDAKYPEMIDRPDLMTARFGALLRTDGPAAVAYVQKMAAPGGPIARTPRYALTITRAVGNATASVLTQTQWKAIATALDPMMSPGTSPYEADYFAYADLLLLAGDRDSAVFYQRKGVNIIIASQHQENADKAAILYLKTHQEKLDSMTAAAK